MTSPKVKQTPKREGARDVEKDFSKGGTIRRRNPGQRRNKFLKEFELPMTSPKAKQSPKGESARGVGKDLPKEKSSRKSTKVDFPSIIRAGSL